MSDLDLNNDRELNRNVEVAVVDFFEKLDSLCPEGVTSDVWLPFIAKYLGENSEYEYWVSEAWESIGPELVGQSNLWLPVHGPHDIFKRAKNRG